MKTNFNIVIIVVLVVIIILLLAYTQTQSQPILTPTTSTPVASATETPARFGNYSNGVVPPQVIIIKESPAINRRSPYPPTYTDDVIDPNINRISYWNYTDHKATERIMNPLLPPERSYVPTYGVPVNVPTRGIVGGFQQVGMLYKDDIENSEKKPGNNTDSTVIALYGRPVDTSRNKWSYYATGDGYQMVKIPITNKGRKCDTEFGCEEITTNDEVKLPSYNGAFKAEIYDYDKPRYIPSVW